MTGSMQRPDDVGREVAGTHLQARRALAGDPRAFEELYARLAPDVIRGTRLLLGSGTPCAAEVVEDAVQEAFADVFTKMKSGEGEFVRKLASDEQLATGHFCAYVLRAAEHNVLDALRRERAEKRGGGRVRRFSSVLREATSLLDLIVASTEDGIEKTLRAEQEERVREAIEGLPKRQREVLAMTLLDLNATEIAQSGFVTRKDGGRATPELVRTLRRDAIAQIRRRLGAG